MEKKERKNPQTQINKLKGPRDVEYVTPHIMEEGEKRKRNRNEGNTQTRSNVDKTIQQPNKAKHHHDSSLAPNLCRPQACLPPMPQRGGEGDSHALSHPWSEK